ncbi:hypothetical protein D3C83_299150 [compost metagenome]
MAIHPHLKQQREKSFEKMKPSVNSFLPAGFYKTNKGFMVEIDHANIDVGQITEYGIIVAIHP